MNPLTIYVLAAPTFALYQAPVQAADSRPITLINPLPPGGILDFQGRTFITLHGNKVDCSAQYPGPSLPFIKTGQLRALASFSATRYKNYEDVPTFKELGYNQALIISFTIKIFCIKKEEGIILARV